MGGNVAKTPLIAIINAALLSYVGGFLPYSEGYRGALNTMAAASSLLDLLLSIGYCLLIAIVAALVFAAVNKSGTTTLLLMIPAFLGLQWVVPLLQQLMIGEVTGVMTTMDTILYMVQGAASTLIVLLLCMLLFPRVPAKQKPNQPQRRYKLRPLNLLIMLIVLPVFYFILHFVVGYFLGWKNEAARAYYSGGADGGFFFMLIEMLIHHLKYGGVALLRGFLMAVFPITLMTLMPDKRPIFIAVNTMLCLSGGLIYLLPSPVMDFSIRITHLITYGAIHLVYGAVSGVLLHTCYARLEIKGAPQPVSRAEPQPTPAPAKS